MDIVVVVAGEIGRKVADVGGERVEAVIELPGLRRGEGFGVGKVFEPAAATGPLLADAVEVVVEVDGCVIGRIVGFPDERWERTRWSGGAPGLRPGGLEGVWRILAGG